MAAKKTKPETQERVRAVLQGGAGTIAKWFLQYHGLARGANDTVEQLAVRIAQYVDEGKLSLADVDTMLRELREYGEKRVYLLQGVASELKAFKPTPNLNPVEDLADARVRISPKNPIVSYTYADSKRIRISVSETHQVPIVNYTSSQVDWVPTTRVVVIEAERATGFVTLSFDAPGARHSHGDRAVDYFDYFHKYAATTLGTDLVPRDLRGLLHAVESSTYGSVVRLCARRVKTPDGVDLNMECGGDLRDATSFKRVQSSKDLRKSSKLFWHATEEPGLGIVPVGIIRQIRTEVWATPAMIKFTAHTLAREVDHVVGEVRRLV